MVQTRLSNSDHVLTFELGLISRQKKKTSCYNVIASIAILSETNVESIVILQGTKAGK